MIQQHPQSSFLALIKQLPAAARWSPLVKIVGWLIVACKTDWLVRESTYGDRQQPRTDCGPEQDQVADLIRSGRQVEKSTLAQALKLVVEDRVFINGRRTVVF